MASENEQKKSKTLADIAAEMRTRSREVKEAFGGRPDGVENMLDIWAERIEAIDSADAWRSLYTPGNASATREALEMARDALKSAEKYVYGDPPDGGAIGWDDVWPSEWHHALEAVERALSAPARQCDVGTANEQGIRFEDFCFAHKSREHGCSDCPAMCFNSCELGWAQTPYEAAEGGAK